MINLGEWSSQLRSAPGVRSCAQTGRSVVAIGSDDSGAKEQAERFAARVGTSRTYQCLALTATWTKQQKVIDSMAAELELAELVNFASTYFVGTRLLKPLLARALGGKMDPANPNAEWNRWFSTLPACGDYGTQKLFVFHKR